MIVIYTQDETIIKKDADAAKGDLIRVYGEKLGAEACKEIKDGRPGAAYRKHGGPLVKVVSKVESELIRERAHWQCHLASCSIYVP